MILTKKAAMILFISTVSFVYLWNIILQDFEFLSVIGTSLFPIIVGSLSFTWTFKTYRWKKGKEKYIWLLFSIGLILHMIGNGIWFLDAIANGIYKAPDSSYLFWLLAYFFFLIALFYKMRLISHSSILTNPYLFNTIIFIVVILAISIHYLVSPYLATEENPVQFLLIGLFYPVVDISILFVTTFLYYLLRQSKDRTMMLCFLGAFYLQVFGDSITAMMKTNKDYYQLFIEPLWVGSLLLIGFAGLIATRNHQSISEVKDTVDEKESIFSYISSVVLIVLTYGSFQWKINALSVGVGLVFIMTIGRQLFIISKNKKLVLEYYDLAYRDELTGLLNRSSFKIDLEAAITRAKNANGTLAVLLIDLDRFKMINDTLGHLVGDVVLKVTARRLRNSLGKDCRIYRLGGDEFVVLLEDATKEKCMATANQIMFAINRTFTIHQHEILITPSVGISSFPDNANDGDALFKAADAAMYTAKGKGRNNYQFYDSELNQILTRKMILENELRKAIGRNELTLLYQPKFHVMTREMTGMEALLRWNSIELGPISPAEFIPIAEDTGLIVSIGEWVLKQACLQNKRWQEKGFQSLCMSVNVSVQQMKNSNLVKTVERILVETGLSPELLELEITESIMQNVQESKEVLRGLRKLGVKIALDDFGTGYSSLHVLKNLPINTLKIDKTFIDDITVDEDHSLVKGIIDIASNLNLDIVAEGVEHDYQLQALANYQCHHVQGYIFSKPISALELERNYLQNRSKETVLLS
ncbi:putative bifunctional diguanylate cyclase/phosphodiesterase [Neobacillus sp. D3-1R]|uniref:putative bifunctional diguanylate cyclase/phosphodiesterase n=1 Tax=Neobacillus sp. D3-1R TaxID=3445778 RepID=UPI003F9F6108